MIGLGLVIFMHILSSQYLSYYDIFIVFFNSNVDPACVRVVSSVQSFSAPNKYVGHQSLRRVNLCAVMAWR
jgi:hypothetical protein